MPPSLITAPVKDGSVDLPAVMRDPDAEDWDVDIGVAPTASSSSQLASWRNAKSSISAPVIGGATEDWDDDEDFDLPPASSKPLKLSLSPRTKLKIDNARATQSMAGLDLSVPEEDDEPGNASTIKVSAIDFSKYAPETPPRPVPIAPPLAPTAMDEDLEGDLDLPQDLSVLSLKPLPILTHRASKASLDGWEGLGSTPQSTSSSTAFSSSSGPSPARSSTSNSLTEDEMDELDFPESISGTDLNRILDTKKRGLLFPSTEKGSVRVVSGDDDFELGLVIDADDELSPSRLKARVGTPPVPRRVTLSEPKPAPRVEPQAPPPPSSFHAPPPPFNRPPSRLREEIPISGRTSRESDHSVASTSASTKPKLKPTLRRTPSTIVIPSKPTGSRPSPTPRSMTMKPPVPRAPSPSKIPLPSEEASSPSNANPNRLQRQKSLGRLPLTRKASLSSLTPPVPALPDAASRLSPTGRSGLGHMASFRDIGAAATVGVKRFAFEATTAATRVKRATGGTMSDSERPPVATVTSSSRTRGSINNIFPSATLPPRGLVTKRSTLTSPTIASAQRAASPQLPSPKPSSPSPVPPAPLVRVLRRPKKPQVFGDGSELDAIEDLTVERERESMFRVAPTGRGNVGLGRTVSVGGRTVGKTASEHGGSERGGHTGGRSASEHVGGKLMGYARPTSSSAKHADSAAPGSKRQQTMTFPRSTTTSGGLFTPPNPKRAGPKKKPTLIRNLSGVSSPKVVGDMNWNPKTLKWEGNDSVLKEFDLTSSTRPALITHLTATAVVGALASPPGSLSSLAGGARVVGEMMFDPVKMCWLSRTGEEEDPFAGFEDEDDWDADGRGETIRAVVLLPGSQRSESGFSGNSSSPARSSLAQQHARSVSESDFDAESMAGDDGGTVFTLPSELVMACASTEERHRAEMRGWHVAASSSSKRRSTSAIDPPDRSYLWDIRTLATRNY